jgi:hypothetical protein
MRRTTNDRSHWRRKTHAALHGNTMQTPEASAVIRGTSWAALSEYSVAIFLCAACGSRRSGPDPAISAFGTAHPAPWSRASGVGPSNRPNEPVAPARFSKFPAKRSAARAKTNPAVRCGVMHRPWMEEYIHPRPYFRGELPPFAPTSQRFRRLHDLLLLWLPKVVHIPNPATLK